MMQLKNKLNIVELFIISLMVFTIVSCKSYYSALTIETPVPSKEELPDDIQSLTLMNRSINNQYTDLQEDSLQNYFYSHDYQLAAVILDIHAADTTLLSLADLLYSSGRYDVTVPVERNIKRDNPYNEIPDTLSSETVRKICEEYNTDALLVMEQFSTKAMTDFTDEKWAGNDGTYHNYYASLDMKYNAFFRIYKPGSKTIEIPLNDTIYWDRSDDNLDRMFRNLPTIKQALVSAGIKVALDVDAKISPTWIPEKRGYFLFSRKNDRGKQLMDENKTDEARDYWMQMAQSDKKKIKGRAEYNLALASELDGDLDQATEWALKSYNTYYQYQTELYLKKLDAKKASKLTK
ncbi:MAG TPA: DUF6340 family protein [Prolixibacteraceae bacterium]|nr:DUF6340 family protein [Prolixibacteraceae bacterium]